LTINNIKLTINRDKIESKKSMKKISRKKVKFKPIC